MVVLTGSPQAYDMAMSNPGARQIVDRVLPPPGTHQGTEYFDMQRSSITDSSFAMEPWGHPVAATRMPPLDDGIAMQSPLQQQMAAMSTERLHSVCCAPSHESHPAAAESSGRARRSRTRREPPGPVGRARASRV